MQKRTYLLVGVVVLVLLLLFVGVWFKTSDIYSSYQFNSEKVFEGTVADVSPIFYGGGRKELNAVPEDSISDEQAGVKSEPATKANNSRLIIKTGSWSLVVKDVRVSVKNITAFANEKGGFVVTSQVNESGVAPSASITIRVPSEMFDSGVVEIKKLGDVDNESITGQDVTEEYVDLNAQLKNLHATEEQFLNIMKQAVKIKDILDVQSQLSSVRDQIERITGRVKYLEQSAKLSTLTVYLSTDPSQLPTLEVSNKWRPLAVVKDASRYLLEAGKSLANMVIWLVVLIPLWAVIFGVMYGVRKLIKKFRNK